MNLVSKIKIHSLKALESALDSEKDINKREQLKLLLDEMAEVYPDESEIPDDPYKLFYTPNYWKKKLKKSIVMGIKGHSSHGKTYEALSVSHLTPKYIEHEFKGISNKERENFKKFIDEFYSFTPVWVIGCESSTLECLTSMDNEGYFEHANINYVEVQQKGRGLSLVDHVKTYKNFLIAMYTLSNIKGGTIIIDPISAVLNAQHEIVRRIIMKVPSLKKHQGVPTRHWFWRNTEQEGIMFYGRIVEANFIFTVKVITQHLEGGEDIEKIRWHEETNKHLSSIIVNNDKVPGKNIFRSTIEKCRLNNNLVNRTYENMTLPTFMYNLYLSKKELKSKS